MNKYILRFGLYGGALLVILSLAVWIIGGGTALDYRTAEAIGYGSMLISLSFVYFGVKAYRDQQNNGIISFGEALKVGTLISLLPALAFAIYTIIFFMIPDIGKEWTDYALANMSEVERAQFESNKALFMNPFFQGIIMFFTVFVIGCIYALISAFILKRQAVAA